MNVAVIYVYPMVQLGTYFKLAARFASTWKQFPPGNEPYTLHVIGNGGEVPELYRQPFNGIPNVQWHQWNNVGWDIGAFQYAAETIPCDLLVCLGSPVHFHRSGWLDRMVDAFLNNGPALYGCWAYLSPNWHVRTTVFWFPPELLKSYPYQIGSNQKVRYGFEHGKESFTRHVMSIGLECWMVSWDHCAPFKEWTQIAPGIQDSLVHDQFTYR